MADPAPLHRSAEVEDLTNLTAKDKKNLAGDVDQSKSSLHRSEEMEDLAHISPKDITKPLVNDHSTANTKQHQ